MCVLPAGVWSLKEAREPILTRLVGSFKATGPRWTSFLLPTNIPRLKSGDCKLPGPLPKPGAGAARASWRMRQDKAFANALMRQRPEAAKRPTENSHEVSEAANAENHPFVLDEDEQRGCRPTT